MTPVPEAIAQDSFTVDGTRIVMRLTDLSKRSDTSGGFNPDVFSPRATLEVRRFGSTAIPENAQIDVMKGGTSVETIDVGLRSGMWETVQTAHVYNTTGKPLDVVLSADYNGEREARITLKNEDTQNDDSGLVSGSQAPSESPSSESNKTDSVALAALALGAIAVIYYTQT